jgi:uncharacterized protein
MVTLGVSDLERATSFYEELGWRPALVVEETVFFQMNGAIVVLWAREKLAQDAGVADAGAAWGGITLAQNVATDEEVDEVIERARRSGGRISREPARTFYGGYAGYFLDPDGHAWEVAHNPGFGLDDEGNILLPRG